MSPETTANPFPSKDCLLRIGFLVIRNDRKVWVATTEEAYQHNRKYLASNLTLRWAEFQAIVAGVTEGGLGRLLEALNYFAATQGVDPFEVTGK